VRQKVPVPLLALAQSQNRYYARCSGKMQQQMSARIVNFT
jgi:hypothetical protein